MQVTNLDYSLLRYRLLSSHAGKSSRAVKQSLLLPTRVQAVPPQAQEYASTDKKDRSSSRDVKDTAKVRGVRKLRRGEKWDPQAHAAQLRHRSIELQQQKKSSSSGSSNPNAPPKEDRLPRETSTASMDANPRKSLFVQSIQQKRSHERKPGRSQNLSSNPRSTDTALTMGRAMDGQTAPDVILDIKHRSSDPPASKKRSNSSWNGRQAEQGQRWPSASSIDAQRFSSRADSTPRGQQLRKLPQPPPVLRNSTQASSSSRDTRQAQRSGSVSPGQLGDSYADMRKDRRSSISFADESSSDVPWDGPPPAQHEMLALPPIDLPVPIRRETHRSTATFFTSESFEEAGATPELVNALAAINITRPSFIQAAALKAFRQAPQHLVVADHAGSGKTLAYLIPLVQQLREHEAAHGSKIANANSPAIIVVLPTTELCTQVLRVARALSKGGAPYRSIGITGGHKKKVQRDSLQEGPDMVIGTPGRLYELLMDGELRLDNCQAVVLDEVDVLLGDTSMFHEQVAPLKEGVPAGARFVLVTASLAEQTWMYLQQQFAGIRLVLGPGLHRPAPGSVEQLVDCSGGDDISEESGFERKAVALLKVIEDQPTDRTVVFCNKISTCRKVENTLNRNLRGTRVLPYHTAIEEVQRKSNLQAFLKVRTDDTKLVLVCTDRASRGVDTSAVEHVVLFDFPRDPSEYVRRAGRTARGAGGHGVVSLLVLGRQVALAKQILERNEKGLPLHRVPVA